MTKINFSLFLVFGLLYSSFTNAQTSNDCGAFRTQTQGGWGTNAAGNNPGTYRDANFNSAFPDGVTIGCEYSLHFNSSSAVQDFLPEGGPPAVLDQSQTDPINIQNVLSGQVLALSLSVGFDSADPSFSASDTPLSGLIINQGILQGHTVSEALQIANEVLGACSKTFSPSQVNEVISSINENFVDGTMDNGFLDCPEAEALICSLQLDQVLTACIADSLYTVDISLSGSNGAYSIIAPSAISGNETTLCFDTTLSSQLIQLTYSQGTDYAFEVIQIDDVLCSAMSSNNCAIPLQTGTTPDCCQLTVICPSSETTYLECISDIPVDDENGIDIISSCGPVEITVTESQSGNGCSNNPLVLVRTYTISDTNDETTCTVTYQVADTEDPVIICPSDETFTCTSGNLFPSAWAVATDNCDTQVAVFFSDLPSPSCSNFERLWTARDDCNNTATCVQQIIINDNTPPNLIVPQNKIIDCLSSTQPNTTGQAYANDVCSDVTLTYIDANSGVDACTSEIQRTWTAEDECGNIAQDIQIITVRDLIGPVISNLAPGTNLQCEEMPEPDSPIAIDACSGDTIAVTLDEMIQVIGCRSTITRTYSAIDDCGNSSSSTRIIVIDDTVPPSMNCPDDIYAFCGDSIPLPSEIDYPEATDNCSGSAVVVTYVDTEINYNACPPVIDRTWSATDDCGNVTDCVQHIFFQDTIAPSIDCPSDVNTYCGDGQTIDPSQTGEAVAMDECSEVNLSYFDGPLTGNCPKTFVRTWSAIDACNNNATCNQTITINDTITPVLTCAPDIVISCAFSDADPSLTGSPSVTGECTDPVLTYVDGTISGECPKVFNRTWIATDFCGNSSTCIQTISLEDDISPVVFCPSDTTVLCTADLIPASLGEATAIDICSSVLLTYYDEESSDGCSQSILRSWSAMDACGNSQSCIQTISLIADSEIVIICPENVTVDLLSQTIPSNTGSPEVQSNCAMTEMTYVDVITYEEVDSVTTECGTLRTQTQGGWGTNANGGNPGTYRDANFDAAFPDGIIIGCDYELTFTTSNAVAVYLPCGGTPAVLSASLVNPQCINNTLSSQLLALSLSVGFDNNDLDFGSSDVALSDMIIANGLFADWTVAELLEEANLVFGGCSNDYTPSQMNQVLSSINENYVDGSQDNGFLTCDEDTSTIPGNTTIERTWEIITNCQDTSYCVQIITVLEQVEAPGTQLSIQKETLTAYPSPTAGQLFVEAPLGARDGDMLRILDLNGSVISQQTHESSSSFWMDLSTLEMGMYLLSWQTDEQFHVARIVKY